MPPLRAAARSTQRGQARRGQSTPGSSRTTHPVGDDKQKRAAMLLAALFVLSFGAILFILYQIFLGGQSADVGPPKPGFVIPANARHFNSLSEFEKSKLTPGVPFAVTLTEAEINQRIDGEMAKQPNAPYRNLRAKVLDDRLDFSGLIRAAGVEMNATVGIRFFAQAGRVAYEIQSLNFGPIPVPGVARQAISDGLDRQIDSQKFTDQWVLDDVEARVGAVTLIGHPK